MVLDTKMQQRELWVDIAKAVCIILMVIGHIGVSFVQYIYVFHMAAFFILSGYTYSGEKYTWLDYCWKKFATLLIPMFMVNTFFIGFYALMVKLNLYSYVETETYIGFFGGLKRLFSASLSCTELGGATWFLIALFFAETLFKTIQRCVNDNSKYDMPIALLIGVGGYCLSSKGIYLPFTFDLGLYASFFFTVGVFLRRKEALEKFNSRFMSCASVAILYILVKYYFTDRLPMNWPTRQFDNIIIQFISIFCGFYVCYCVSKYVIKLKRISIFFSYLGQHTYTVLAFHFFVFRFITLCICLAHRLPLSALKEFPITPRLSPYWYVIAPTTLTFCMLMSWIADKNLFLNFLINGRPFFLKLRKQ